jgi:sarcosine oxidase subunit alpha
MPQSYRLDNIGLINRDKKLSFKFNGVLTLDMKGTL